MLYPIDTETREVIELAGLWNFKVESARDIPDDYAGSALSDYQPMAVPASYNDLTQDPSVRDHIGWVLYERTFFGRKDWSEKRVVLRFGSVTHHAKVWFDGQCLGAHKGGYLPFEFCLPDAVADGKEHRLTVAVGNVLDWTTLPPGELVEHEEEEPPSPPASAPWIGYGRPKGHRVQRYFHDFFNYAGIHRPVRLHITPKAWIEDVSLVTESIDGGAAQVSYQTEVGGEGEVSLTIRDKTGAAVASAEGAKGRVTLSDAHLWEPGEGYQYTFEFVLSVGGKQIDVYRQPFGLRTVKVEGNRFLINGKPFYFKGFGKHEDSELRGKGHDPVLDVKDFNLMKWIGANSFRTAHYPYGEEIMRFADAEGIVVIDESPAVGLWNGANPVFCEGRVGDEMLAHHLDVMTDLVKRDKNHACVVMWSVANEVATWQDGAREYLSTVADHTRKLDSTRPVTCVFHSHPANCQAMDLFEIVCINRYFSWYEDCGHLEIIDHQLTHALEAIHERTGSPILITEYGADSIAGMHLDPPEMFSEEYQCEMLDAFHRVFDRYDYVIGEHVWNFADFRTKQEPARVLGNRKGAFTRNRQPKMAAHLLRRRWKGE